MALMVKSIPANAEDLRNAGGHGNPLQYSCPEDPMDRGGWQATVNRVASVGHHFATRERKNIKQGFPGGASGKVPSGSILGPERYPWGGHGNLLQYSCLENPMDRESWWATVYRVARSCT